MKNKLNLIPLTFFLLLVIAAGCSKNDANEQVPSVSTISGNWQLAKDTFRQYGASGYLISEISRGPGKVYLNLNADGSYVTQQSSTEDNTQAGKYSITGNVIKLAPTEGITINYTIKTLNKHNLVIFVDFGSLAPYGSTYIQYYTR